MTPKEKATDLVYKMKKIIDYYGIYEAKKCALIAVNELIDSESVLVQDLLLEQSKRIAQCGVQYWNEVKNEIINL